jgi:hypothetical protein
VPRTPEDDEVYTITQAQRGLSREQVGRTRKYLISMGIRTACVIAAIVVPGWPKWVFIVGAVVLPYLAVVVANAGRENDEPGQVGPVPLENTPLQLEPVSDLGPAGGPIIVSSRAADPDR